jgi:glyoxylase-like metal-dependent hydrolase (beta-lactamase superfamily II)
MSGFKISAVEGNRQWLDGGAMFGNAPRAVWEKWTPPDGLGRIELACRSLLIEGEGQRVLCETGIGAFFEPKLAERYGVQTPDRHILLESLKTLGIAESEIDFVILSHLHFDHAGGLMPKYAELAAGRSDLLFPKAKYVVGREAWERACKPHPRDRASFIPGMTDKLIASGRLVIVDKDVVPGLWESRLGFVRTSGHTPGQLHTVFRGDTDSVFFAGDLVPGTAWVHLPITMGYDRYAEMVIDEKSKIYEDVTAKNRWVFYTHDAKWDMSRIVKDPSGKYMARDNRASVTRIVI